MHRDAVQIAAVLIALCGLMTPAEALGAWEGGPPAGERIFFQEIPSVLEGRASWAYQLSENAETGETLSNGKHFDKVSDNHLQDAIQQDGRNFRLKAKYEF